MLMITGQDGDLGLLIEIQRTAEGKVILAEWHVGFGGVGSTPAEAASDLLCALGELLKTEPWSKREQGQLELLQEAACSMAQGVPAAADVLVPEPGWAIYDGEQWHLAEA